MRLQRVEIDSHDGPVLYVSGADLVDGTPIYDIKPYLPYVDCHPDATEGYTGQTRLHQLQVEFPAELLARYPQDKQAAIVHVLEMCIRDRCRTEHSLPGVGVSGKDNDK